MTINGESFLSYFEFASFSLFLFFALLQLNHRKKFIVNYFLAGVFFAGSYQFLYLWMFGLGLLEKLPVLLYTEIAVCFLIGPLFFRYFRIISGLKVSGRLPAHLHYIPFLVSLTVIVFFNIKNPEAVSLYSEKSLILPEYHSFPIIELINSLGDLSMAVYFSLSIYYSSILFRSRDKSPELRGILVFLVLIVINVFLSIISTIFDVYLLFILTIVSFSTLPIYYIFFSFKYPEYCQKVISVSKDIRYKQSMVKRLDLEKVEERLNELMEVEKVFIDSNLSLNSFSSRLMLTPHQLSAFLNARKGMNFRTYINTYRVVESRRLLDESRETGILDIAYSVGFNSKSVFNSAFLRETGMSPTEYRKKEKIAN